tara:strand:- start:1587 stop:2108 length:522 start_codon:yes stop_codon:yes gene_type:complete
MKNKYLIIIIIILGFHSSLGAQNDDELVTIYLVRHSEKDLLSNDHSDPPLSKCGEQRSESLSVFLREVNLDVIYSTDYNRTRKTALPTALSKGLIIKKYNSQYLEEFSKSLINNKQDVLVVGHSNTTAVLAGLLVGKELEAFDLDIYDRIYQVVISKNASQINLLHSTFVCTD